MREPTIFTKSNSAYLNETLDVKISTRLCENFVVERPWVNSTNLGLNTLTRFHKFMVKVFNVIVPKFGIHFLKHINLLLQNMILRISRVIFMRGVNRPGGMVWKISLLRPLYPVYSLAFHFSLFNHSNCYQTTCTVLYSFFSFSQLPPPVPRPYLWGGPPQDAVSMVSGARSSAART